MTLKSVKLSVARRGRMLLSDVSLDFDQGVTALLGPNGAGKTTLLNVLATAATATSGAVICPDADHGTQRSMTEVRRRIGWLPQRFTLVPSLTVEETVTYAAWCRGIPSKDARAAALEAIDRVMLNDLSARRIRTLSGGQRQRVGLACALVHHPDVLLLDEPTAGLDPAQRNSFKDLIAEYGRSSTVVYATHILSDVDGLAKTYVVLSGGRVLFNGDSNDLRAQAAVGLNGTLEQGYTAVSARSLV